MDTTAIRDAILRQPFEPFELHLADGRTMPVPHREFVAVTSRQVFVGFADGTSAILEPLLIVSLEPMPAKGKDRDGSAKKKRPPGT